MNQITPDSISSLESVGLLFLIYNPGTKEILAAFSEEDDADLFMSASLPKDSDWAVGRIVRGVVHQKQEK